MIFYILKQGVSRALVDNSRTLRLPNHLHERLGLIRNAKIRLEEKGITPSIDVSAMYFLYFEPYEGAPFQLIKAMCNHNM